MEYQNKKFLIVDGSSLAHRAFYALPPLTTRQGVHTNAAYGFLTMLLRLLENEEFHYVAVAFDKGRITFRNELYSDYKGHRKATPPELRPQFDLIKKILSALRIPAYELENYEADDLIGTLANKAGKAGFEVSILTGDRDTLQLITEKVKVLLTRRGITNLEAYDLQKIKEKYELEPIQLIDVKGLMGDSSDNIPGVPGVGEKTALRLIRQYATLEDVLANIEEVSGPKLRENLKKYQQQAILSKQLATIDLNAPFEFSFKDSLYQEPDYQALLNCYRELEFNSLIEKTLVEMEQDDEFVPNEDKYIVEELSSLDEFKEKWKKAITKPKIAFELLLDEENPFKGNLLGVGFATDKHAWGLSVEKVDQKEILNFLADQLNSQEKKWILHDVKKNIVFLNRFKRVSFSNYQDTMLAAYLLNPSKGQRSLAEIVLEHLDLPLVEGDNPGRNAGERASHLFRLFLSLKEKLKSGEMYDLYQKLELPLAAILADMEIRGVKLDVDQLSQMGMELNKQIEDLTNRVHEFAGEEFNINSPKQLGEILFKKLGLPPIKRTKTGFSTNAEVLEKLLDRHPIIPLVLQYRQLVKLYGTYIEGLQGLVDPDTDKVHTTFNQGVTATGRLSSQEPNLQNIPIRMEQGRLIRKAFIPSQPGWFLLAADYSQIELRVLAHISQDENLIDAFKKGQDIHARTASEVFEIPIDQIDGEMRRQAKAVNFGIVYGISDYGLSRDLGIPVYEAEKFINLYFARYPGVKNYIDKIVQQARQEGYVSTLLNRRRYLPELFSSNRNLRSFGERAAMNTPIQGSAADIIKLAMIKINDVLKKQKLKTQMILQVHDELIFEVPEDELETVSILVKEGMEKAFILDIPLLVEVKKGYNWYDMEEVRG